MKNKRFYKCLSVFLSALILSMFIFSNFTLVTQASTLPSVNKWLDTILSSSGVSAKLETIQKYHDVMNKIITDAHDDAVANDLLNDESVSGTFKTLLNDYLNAVNLQKDITIFDLKSKFLGSDYIEEMYQNSGLGGFISGGGTSSGSGVGRQKNVTVGKEDVETIVKDFTSYYNEYNDYYVVQSYKYTDYLSQLALLNSNVTKESLELYKAQIEKILSRFPLIQIYAETNTSSNPFTQAFCINSSDYLVSSYIDSGRIQFNLYNSNWQWGTNLLNGCYGQQLYYMNTNDIEDFDIQFTSEQKYNLEHSFTTSKINSYGGTELCKCVISLDGRSFIIFKNTTAMKAFDLGVQDVYFSPTITYNTVSYNTTYLNSGDYIYSYDTVQNNVTNNNGLTYAEVQDIVNNALKEHEQTTTTIINNYYSDINTNDSNSSVSGGDSSGGSSNTNIFGFISKLGDVLGSLISNVGELLVKILSGLVNVFNNLTNVIPESINGFMTSLFSFLPPEWINIITLGLSLSLILIMVKFFRG